MKVTLVGTVTLEEPDEVLFSGFTINGEGALANAFTNLQAGILMLDAYMEALRSLKQGRWSEDALAIFYQEAHQRLRRSKNAQANFVRTVMAAKQGNRQ